MVPRSERNRFSDHVEALLLRLGVRADDVAERLRKRLLHEARHRRLNDHEAALTVAHGHALELMDAELERARVLVDRLELVAAEWDGEDLIDRSVIMPLQREARLALRRNGA